MNPLGTLFVADERKRNSFGVAFLRMNECPVLLQRALVESPFDLTRLALDDERSDVGIIHVVRRTPPIATVAVFVPDGIDRHVAQHELRQEYGGQTRLWDVPVGTPIIA